MHTRVDYIHVPHLMDYYITKRFLLYFVFYFLFKKSTLINTLPLQLHHNNTTRFTFAHSFRHVYSNVLGITPTPPQPPTFKLNTTIIFNHHQTELLAVYPSQTGNVCTPGYPTARLHQRELRCSSTMESL